MRKIIDSNNAKNARGNVVLLVLVVLALVVICVCVCWCFTRWWIHFFVFTSTWGRFPF